MNNNGRSSHGSWSDGHDAPSATVKPPTAEEVIERIKDDGDFDRLRRKIINKLRSNEALRSNIYSAVKQSKALTGAVRNVKPRQLLDIIHQEMGTELMGQMSDAVWELIRSKEAMGREISETVETVYNRMVNDRRKAQEMAGAPSNHSPASTDQHSDGRGLGSSPPTFTCDQQTAGKEVIDRSTTAIATHEMEMTGKQVDTCQLACDESSHTVLEPHKASVLSLAKPDQHHNKEAAENGNHPGSSRGVLISSNTEPSELAVSQQNAQSQKIDDNDIDPDVPPGFG